MAVLKRQSYSAHVEAWLVINNERMALGSVGPTFCHPRDRHEIKAGTKGTLELVVDHTPVVWNIKVTDDVVPWDDRIDFKIDDPTGREHKLEETELLELPTDVKTGLEELHKRLQQ